MMLRRIARPMLAAWFVTEGVAGFRGAAHHLEPTRTGADALVERLQLTRPTDEQIRTAVKVHGAATAGAGLALALGKAPRVAALVLAALTLPAAVVNILSSRKAATPAAKAERRERATLALSFTGAALIAAADREGRPGLAWKVSHARKLAAASAGAGVLGARSTGDKAAKATKAVKAATAAEAKAAAKATKAVKAATVTQAKAATKATGKGAGAVTAVLGVKAAKTAKAAKAASSTQQSSGSGLKPSRSEARAARAAARTDAKAAAVAEKRGAKAAKATTRADAKAAKLAEKDAARAAKAAAAAEADALKAAKTAQRADAKAAKRLRRSTGSVVTPG